MKKVFFLFALALLAFGTQQTFAADGTTPGEGSLGLGVAINTYPFVSNNLGGVIGYNISNNLQIGLKLGFGIGMELDVPSVNGTETKTYTSTLIGPYARYYLSTIKTLRPFVDAGMEIGTYQRINGDYTYMRVNVGGEWNPYKSFGIIGGLNFVSYESNHKVLNIGLGAPFIGATWYF